VGHPATAKVTRAENELMTCEPQIEALREEIRRAGTQVRQKRITTVLGVFAPLAAIVLITVLFFLGLSLWNGWIAVLALLGIALFALTAIGVIASLLALFVAARCRSRECKRLRVELARLDLGSCAQVLTTLRTSRPGDTRKIAEALARDIGLPAELVPAAAPSARCDEASPAEETR
jgi:hypothetical protein